MKKIYFILFSLISIASHAQWKYANFPTGGQVLSITQHGTTIFAGTPTGIFQSTDNGDNWIQNNQVSLYNIICFAVNGNDVYAGTDEGVYKTSDDGVNWTRLGITGIGSYERIQSIVFKGSAIFIATSKGIYSSTNQGNSWVKTNPISGASNSVNELFVSGNNLLAGSYPHLYLSSDGGASWKRADSTASQNIIAFSFAKTSQKLYAGGANGLFYSTDDGNNWVKDSIIPDQYIRSLTAKNDSVLAGTLKGLYRSVNNGTSWELFNTGLGNDSTINGTTVFKDRIYAATRQGIYVFDETKKSWSAKNNGLQNKGLVSLATIGSKLFAGTFEGAYVSIDSSKSWIELNNGVPYNDAALTFGETPAKNLYICTVDHGMLLSKDDGKNWTMDLALPKGLNTIVTVNGKLYSGSYTHGLLMSDDEGNTWSDIALPSFSSSVNDIASNGNNIYVGTDKGFILSTDKGVNWDFASDGIAGVNCILVNKNRIIVDGQGDGVYYSDDNAMTWKLATGLSANAYILDFEASGNTVFATSYKDGIFASLDNGETWKSIQDNLKNLQTRSLTIQNNDLFVGIYGAGVWHRNVNEITPGIAKNKHTFIFNLYPNPSDGVFYIKTALPDFQVEVVNIIGQIIHSGTSKTNQITLDLTGYDTGIYSVRVLAKDGTSSSKKIVVQ